MNFLDKTPSLMPANYRVICEQATEAPHSGAYNQPVSSGTYLCRRCGLALFRGRSQFGSACGWPSFEAEIEGAVQQVEDKDGRRMEIVCGRCHAHLGHVFRGEHLTSANVRHCVNSVSIDFVKDSKVIDSEEVIVAGGCFWGVEYYLARVPGVLKVESGYCGGELEDPSYQQVCSGNTGHYEAVRVIYDKKITNCYEIYKHFFEIHDPAQSNRQGPDIGPQYQSAIFYYDDNQYREALSLIQQLQDKGMDVATQLLQASTFWPAEEGHQNYYAKHNTQPYCHRPMARF